MHFLLKPSANGNGCASDAESIDTVYPYRPLEHESSIRLLLVTPGKVDLAFAFQEDRLGNVAHKYAYKALPYEWGSAAEDEPVITIDGHAVKIRRNLYEALSQIMGMEVDLGLGPFYLWVDALCISQNDNVEKRPQVQMMGKT